jgi:uncharacterized protein (TIGR02217 family)
VTVFARTSQVIAEVVRTDDDPSARTSQLTLEVLRLNTLIDTEVSQVTLEVVRPNAPPPPEVEFPPRIAFGASRTPTWATTLLETFGARDVAIQNWADVRHEYDVSLAIRTATDYVAVLEHFHQMRGRLFVFLLKDFLDFFVALDEGVSTHASGLTFQLQKRYGTVYPYDRKITRPVEGTATFYRTRAGVQVQIFPTVNWDTGVITVEYDDDGDTYQWTGEFRVPVRYGQDRMPAVVADRRPDGGEELVTCDGILLVEEKE